MDRKRRRDLPVVTSPLFDEVPVLSLEVLALVLGKIGLLGLCIVVLEDRPNLMLGKEPAACYDLGSTIYIWGRGGLREFLFL